MVSDLERPKRHHRNTLTLRSTAACSDAKRCRRKFLRMFPRGFRDETYVAWERDYKWTAHKAWQEHLSEPEFTRLLRRKEYQEIAMRAVCIESRTNLLFSFEKMALRDALKSRAGARDFAKGLHAFLHAPGRIAEKFETWVTAIAGLPRKQTRVLTWPLVSVFGFIAKPEEHIFLKPNVTRCAALAYGYDLSYRSKPSWETYASYLAFAALVRHDLKDLRPRDMIDIQSFLWIQGSDEYEE